MKIKLNAVSNLYIKKTYSYAHSGPFDLEFVVCVFLFDSFRFRAFLFRLVSFFVFYPCFHWLGTGGLFRTFGFSSSLRLGTGGYLRDTLAAEQTETLGVKTWIDRLLVALLTSATWKNTACKDSNISPWGNSCYHIVSFVLSYQGLVYTCTFVWIFASLQMFKSTYQIKASAFVPPLPKIRCVQQYPLWSECRWDLQNPLVPFGQSSVRSCLPIPTDKCT